MAITEQQQHKESNRSLEIRILSLNVWGIPIISKDRQPRIEAIAKFLVSSHEPYHYVFLQELWSKDDYRYIAEKVSRILPHSHYFYSGTIGSGLCIFSSTPISEIHFHPWSLSGYPHKVHHADWYGGKGVAMCRTVYQGMPMLLINTHLHAEYDSKSDEYIHHRVSEAFETSQLLRFTSKDSHIAIFAGDFNSSPNDIPFRLLSYNTGFVDTFSDCPTKPVDGVGATCGSASNSYTPIASLRDNPNGKRIDHILYFASSEYQVKTKVHDQPVPPRVPESNFSYSDHEAVRAILSIKPKQPQDAEDTKTEKICFNRTDCLLDASAVCTQGLRTVTKSQKLYACSAFLLLLLLITFMGLYFLQMTSICQFFFTIILLFLFTLLLFCSFMALLFCNHEFNSLMAAKMGLERLLEEVRVKNAQYFEEQKKKAQSGLIQS